MIGCDVLEVGVFVVLKVGVKVSSGSCVSFLNKFMNFQNGKSRVVFGLPPLLEF